jgi:hypothetical protein
MPKDEFDLQDPLELNSAVFLTEEDTTDAMCECFIEEFLRLSYGPEQILALFRDPNYVGTNMVLEKRGEQFVRDAIAETFARWGRPVTWPTSCSSRREEAPLAPSTVAAEGDQSLLTSAATTGPDASANVPAGPAIPKPNPS